MANPTWEDTQEIVPQWEETVPHGDISELESALRGGAQGATLGFAPALTGAAEAIPQALQGKDLLEAYRKARDASNASYKAAEAANPKSFLAGSVAGGILPAAVAPEASALKLGAGFGALSGLGQSVSEGQGLEDTAKNVTGQGVLGGAIGGSLGALLGKLTPESLKESAANHAVESFSPSKSEVAKLMQSPSQSGATNRLQEVGQNLITPNPYTESPLVTAFGNSEERADKLKQVLAGAGKDIGEIAAKIDGSVPIDNNFFNPKDAVNYIDQMKQQYMLNGTPSESANSQFNKLSSMQRDLSRFGDEPVDFKTANKIKDFITNEAYNDNGVSTNKDMAQLRGFVNDSIENALDKTTQSMENPDLFQKYMKAKDLYRTAKQMTKSSNGQVASDVSNRDLGLTDYLSAGIGHSMAGGPGAVVGAIGNKALRGYGNSIAATAQNKTADVMSAIGKKLSDLTPVDFKDIGSSLMASDGAIQKKIGGILVEAAQKDQIGRNALMFSLLQNPDYRDVVKNLFTSGKTQ